MQISTVDRVRNKLRDAHDLYLKTRLRTHFASQAMDFSRDFMDGKSDRTTEFLEAVLIDLYCEIYKHLGASASLNECVTKNCLTRVVMDLDYNGEFPQEENFCRDLEKLNQSMAELFNLNVLAEDSKEYALTSMDFRNNQGVHLAYPFLAVIQGSEHQKQVGEAAFRCFPKFDWMAMCKGTLRLPYMANIFKKNSEPYKFVCFRSIFGNNAGSDILGALVENISTGEINYPSDNIWRYGSLWCTSSCIIKFGEGKPLKFTAIAEDCDDRPAAEYPVTEPLELDPEEEYFKVNKANAESILKQNPKKFDFNKSREVEYLCPKVWAEIITRIASNTKYGRDKKGEIEKEITKELNNYLSLLEKDNTVFRVQWDTCSKSPFVEEIKSKDLAIAFQNYYIEVQSGKDKNNKVKWVKIPLFNTWMKNPGRNTYTLKVFDPTPGDKPSYVLNTYGGLRYAKDELLEAALTKKGQLGKKQLNGHILTILCAGDMQKYNYLMRALAIKARWPWKKVKAMIVMTGNEGAGKSILMHAYGKLFGSYFVEIQDFHKLIKSNFNAILANKLVASVEEGFAPKSVQCVSAMKALVTQETYLITEKYMNTIKAKNYILWFLLSNLDHVVPASSSARRWVIFECANNFRGPNPTRYDAYMQALWTIVDGEDDTALKGWLSQFYDVHTYSDHELEAFGVGQNIPDACREALQRQREHSADVITQFWKKVLERGYVLTDPRQDWLYDEYLRILDREETIKAINSRCPIGRRRGPDFESSHRTEAPDASKDAFSTQQKRNYTKTWLGVLAKIQIYEEFRHMLQTSALVKSSNRDNVTDALFWSTTYRFFPRIRASEFKLTVDPQQVILAYPYGSQIRHLVNTQQKKRFVVLGSLKLLRLQFEHTTGMHIEHDDDAEDEIVLDEEEALEIGRLTKNLQLMLSFADDSEDEGIIEGVSAKKRKIIRKEEIEEIEGYCFDADIEENSEAEQALMQLSPHRILPAGRRKNSPPPPQQIILPRQPFLRPSAQLEMDIESEEIEE
jgi:hypothetical protein